LEQEEMHTTVATRAEKMSFFILFIFNIVIFRRQKYEI
jgi:hypothetical protein